MQLINFSLFLPPNFQYLGHCNYSCVLAICYLGYSESNYLDYRDACLQIVPNLQIFNPFIHKRVEKECIKNEWVNRVLPNFHD